MSDLLSLILHEGQLKVNMDLYAMPNQSTKRQLYFTGILNETLPLDALNEDIYSALDLSIESGYQILHLQLDLNFQRIIDRLDVDDVISWKTGLQNHLLAMFDETPYKVLSCLNLSPFTRTFILSYPLSSDLDDLFISLHKGFSQMNQLLFEHYHGQVATYLGPASKTLSDISPSYKIARSLVQYQFVLGMGCLTRHLDIPRDIHGSLVDYKYLNYYHEYLEQREFTKAYQTIQELGENLREHFATNSRSQYLFKEIISTTLKFFYQQRDNFEALTQLNDGISYFEHRFNDISEVTTWLGSILKTYLNSDNLHLNSSHPYMNRILNLIERHYAKDLSLNEIAEELHVTTAYLSRLFKEHLDINFKEYLTTYRLTKAKELLSDTLLPVKTIGERVGYPNPMAFNRVFKKYEGITPREFKLLSPHEPRAEEKES